ncbi:hypothetical protein DOTSEDRAFT_24146 [Dothistroma septosporum NZE10]|uniref:Uncharacterized protein n=1 Tax=Dothistroma septosporum (strain NZE10 / CBS 128990) TaxID=675120 RepID=N1PKM7_DOTSN|nr:hypothetical protein DOTSEDRAFT_24146 [Dothistroma septosporum NZE10]
MEAEDPKLGTSTSPVSVEQTDVGSPPDHYEEPFVETAPPSEDYSGSGFENVAASSNVPVSDRVSNDGPTPDEENDPDHVRQPPPNPEQAARVAFTTGTSDDGLKNQEETQYAAPGTSAPVSETIATPCRVVKPERTSAASRRDSCAFRQWARSVALNLETRSLQHKM